MTVKKVRGETTNLLICIKEADDKNAGQAI